MRKELTNGLATIIKEHGLESPAGRQAWGRLAEELLPAVEKKAISHHIEYGNVVRVDKDGLVSVALYEGIKYAITNWDINKGDFESRYFHFLPRCFMTHQRNEADSEKVKALAGAYSIETPVDDGVTLGDTLVCNSEPLGILPMSRRIAQMFKLYTQEHGADKADLARIIIIYSDDVAKRNAHICRYFNSETYSPTIRKRVERTRKHFQEFCENNKEILVA